MNSSEMIYLEFAKKLADHMNYILYSWKLHEYVQFQDPITAKIIHIPNNMFIEMVDTYLAKCTISEVNKLELNWAKTRAKTRMELTSNHDRRHTRNS